MTKGTLDHTIDLENLNIHVEYEFDKGYSERHLEPGEPDAARITKVTVLNGRALPVDITELIPDYIFDELEEMAIAEETDR